MLRLLALSSLVVSTSSFFFGTGSGGCACAPPPICPPAPVCGPPPPPPPCPSSCGSSGGGYAAPPILPPIAPLPSIPLSQQPAPAISFPSSGGGPTYAAPAPSLPQSPVYTPPQAPPPLDIQVVAQPQSAGPAYQQGPAPGPIYQQQPAPVAPTAPEVPLPVPSGPVGTYQQPPQAYQGGPVVAAPQRDPAPQELINSLQQEASEVAAAGSKNEEVVEEDVALEKSAVGSSVSPNDIASTVAPEVEEKVVDIANLKLTDDPLCNSEDLRKLMLENIDENLNSSKRLIQLAAEAQFGGRFDVICANGDFSYVTNTELFCQETKGDISCYTYRQL